MSLVLCDDNTEAQQRRTIPVLACPICRRQASGTKLSIPDFLLQLLAGELDVSEQKVQVIKLVFRFI